jgi:hypothetical protein
MRNFLNGLTLIFLVTNIACKQSPSSESEIIETPKTETLEFSHQIEVLDSVVIEDVLTVAFAFQGKAGDHLIFRDKGSAKVFVFDASGKPLYSWEKSGDVLGNFSMIADNFVFDKNGNIVLSDNMAGVRVFSPDGNLISQNRTFQPQTSFHLMVDVFRKNQVIYKGGKVFLIHHLDLMDNVQEVSEAFYKNRKNLLLTDLSNGRTKPILPFPEESKFLSGKAFPFEDFRPVFYYEEQEEVLYLMFQNEALLYAFNWSGDDPVLTDLIILDLPGFSGHEGWEYREVNYGLLNAGQLGSPFPSRIRNLEKVGDDFLISYNPSPGNKSDLAKVQNKEASKELMDKLREESKIRTAVFDMNTKNIGLLDLPVMRFESFRLIDGEIWWMKPASKDMEDEAFVVYRGRVKRRN